MKKILDKIHVDNARKVTEYLGLSASGCPGRDLMKISGQILKATREKGSMCLLRMS